MTFGVFSRPGGRGVARRTASAALLLAALAALLGPAPARADAAAAELFAKHKAYMGWSAGDGSITSLRESGAVTRDGKELREIESLHRGEVFRERSGSYQDGFTGRVLWQSNQNGFTVRANGDAARYVATRQALFGEWLDTTSATVVRSEVLDGTPVTWVRVTPSVGVPAEIAIDPATGAYKRAVLDPNGDYETSIAILGYTDVGGGKRVISSWKYGSGRAIYAYTKIEANVPISDQELHPPPQRAAWTFDPAHGTNPVQLTETRILVDATVNGVKGTFIFDTGAFGIALTDTFARRVGAKRVGESQVYGIGGGARANVYKVDTIAFGASVLHNVVVETGLDERTSHFSNVAGLIGFDLLAGAIVDLNLDAKTMRILDPQSFEPDKNAGITVPVDLTTQTPRVPMTVGGKVPVLAILDSGNPAWVLFSKSLETRDHVSFFVDPTALVQEMRISGINGSEVDPCGKLQSLNLGPIRYAPVPACASDSMARNEVLVGLEFIRSFNTVFDYPDGYLVMTPRKNGRD
ncbi:MAG TPA: retroviral-like aspartic protease family protein [Candidatus Baltobacteraceae bacterium]|nr:retroviral-like aspartic protease family protein [Candidatus Baltobacteraceae bacterium]